MWSLPRSLKAKSCFQETKYVGIVSGMPVCNNCSILELNEESREWIACQSVGYCSNCTRPKPQMRTKCKVFWQGIVGASALWHGWAVISTVNAAEWHPPKANYKKIITHIFRNSTYLKESESNNYTSSFKTCASAASLHPFKSLLLFTSSSAHKNGMFSMKKGWSTIFDRISLGGCVSVEYGVSYWTN